MPLYQGASADAAKYVRKARAHGKESLRGQHAFVHVVGCLLLRLRATLLVITSA